MRSRSRRRRSDRIRGSGYLSEGRLVVAYVDGASVGAVLRTDEGVLNLGFDVDRGWWCSCPSSEECDHLAALKLVTESAVSVSRGPISVPSEAGRRPEPTRREPSGWDDSTGELPVEPFFDDDAWPAPSPDVAKPAGTQPGPDALVDHEEPADEPPARRRLLGVMVALAIAAAIAASMWLAHPFRTATSHGSPARTSPSGSQSPRSTASPSQVPAAPVAALFPNAAREGGLAMQVGRLPSLDADCATHLFAGTAVYQSDCRSWRRRPGAEWFWVSYRNEGSSPVSLVLDRFELRGMPGHVARPIDLRSVAADPQDFLPSTAVVSPLGTEAGWLVFAPPGRWTPRSLLYRSSPSLEVRFAGRASVRPRG